MPCRQPPFDLAAQRPVAVAAVGGELEEVFFLDPLLEFLRGEEVVVAAVYLALARRAGGRRDRQLEVGNRLQQLPDQRSLADPRGAGDDEDLWPCGRG